MIYSDTDTQGSPAWPPLSVWVAAGLLLLLPTALTALLLVFDRWYRAAIPGVWLALALLAVGGLFRGRPRGYGVAVGLVLLLGVLQAVSLAVAAATGAGLRIVLSGLPFYVYLFTVAGLLWWPATRMWCGRLPADPYGEFGPD